MKYRILLCALPLFLSSGMGRTSEPAANGYIVAELFTSEGCSSCPAADALLEEMIGLTAKEGKSVIGLAFHVTYWNHLGWKDPYSDEQFTERQKRYAEVFPNSQLYTPQMIVNGEYEFVGSNPIAFRDAIEKGWSKPSTFTIEGKAQLENNEIKISYSLDKELKGLILNVALVQDSMQNFVSRGENKNRTLHHYNVVRKFLTTIPQDKGELSMSLPDGISKEQASIVLYLQHKKNLKILGALKIGF